MDHVYFHCTNSHGVLVDRRGADVEGLLEARDQALQFVGSLIATPSGIDWRNWVLHVSDEDGEEIFDMPFASVLGKLH